MAAAQYDFVIEQGTTTVKLFVWKSADGTPINLEGYSARMQIRASTQADTYLMELTTENGRIRLTPLEGKIELKLSAAETSAIDWKRGKYDLELVSSTGFVIRLLFGLVTVSKEITREQ